MPDPNSALSLASKFSTWRFRLLGLSLVALLMGHAALDGAPHAEAIMGPIGLIFVAALLQALGPGRAQWPLAALLAAPILVGLFGLKEPWSAAAGSWYHVPLLLVATWKVGISVARAERANEDVVVGSICAYLLAALAFAAIYAGIEAGVPGSFALGTHSDPARGFAQLLSFSLVTITTLGYGDVVPVHDGVRALVSLEAVLGVLYPAIIVSRIVTLAVSGKQRPFAVAPPTERFGGRYRLLTVLLLSTLLLMPWIGQGPYARFGLGLLLLVQLGGAIYATAGRSLLTWVAMGLGLVALADRYWLADSQFGPMALTGFFLLVSFALLRWLLRERVVTREVLFASIAAYLTMGFCLSSLFLLMDHLHPGSIGFPEPGERSRTAYVYFGFMTLTTTGFGDILPATSAAESVATLGALLGLFYPAVLLARLVSLYQAEDA